MASPSRAESLRSDVITCNFTYDAWVDEKEGKFTGTLGMQKSPHVITFVGLNGREPSLQGNGGTAKLLKTADDGNDVQLVEVTASGNVVVYGLSRKLQRAVFAKASFATYGERSAPIAYTMIGRCSDVAGGGR